MPFMNDRVDGRREALDTGQDGGERRLERVARTEGVGADEDDARNTAAGTLPFRTSDKP